MLLKGASQIMQPMSIWVLISVLTLASLAALIVPALRAGRGAQSRELYDREIFKDQIGEIESDVERGVLSETEAEEMRREVARRLLAADAAAGDAPAQDGGARERYVVIASAALAVPAMALGLYLLTGSPHLPDQPLEARLIKPVDPANVRELVARVEMHLRRDPANAQGWKVIAPVYMRLGRFADAAHAYGRLLDLNGPDADTFTEFGEALVLEGNGIVSAKARDAFSRAADLAPDDPKPQYYLALAMAQDGRKDEAVSAWRKLLDGAAPDAPWVSAVRQRIAQATGETVKAPALSEDAVSAASQMSAGDRNEMIEGMVSRLAERLESEGGSVDEWLRLARAQTVLGRRQEASGTLARARGQFGDTPEALSRIDDFGKQNGLDTAQ